LEKDLDAFATPKNKGEDYHLPREISLLILKPALNHIRSIVIFVALDRKIEFYLAHHAEIDFTPQIEQQSNLRISSHFSRF